MLTLIFFYLILPFILAGLVLKFIRKYSPTVIPQDIQRLYQDHPIEKKFFRALRRDHKGLKLLGDFETRGEAVERAYKGKEDAVKAGEKAAFLVLNDKGEALEEVDAS